MKKLTSLILTLSIILTLSACSDNTNNSMTDSGSSSDASSAVSSEASSESEAELTFDEKFRGLDQELRYDEVIKLLGEPDEKGGANVKYLSYKQDDGKIATVQFLYGDNPRIGYTYITDSETEEEEIILHRRICDHENDYCSHDIYYSEEMCTFIDKCKELKHGMSQDEVAEILGEPTEVLGGGGSITMYYYPDYYHIVFVELLYDYFNGEDVGYPWFDHVYISSRMSYECIYPFHSSFCNHEQNQCIHTYPLEQARLEKENGVFERKLENLQLDKTATMQGIFDYIGEPDEELTEDDVTRLLYNMSDGRIGYVCFVNKGDSAILDCSYTYDPTKKKITYFMKVSEDCDPEPYYEYHKNK